MAWTPATLIERFPEWKNAPTALLQSVIDEAYLRLPLDWGARREIGVGYLACQILTVSPFGRGLEIAKDETGQTTYDRQLRILYRVVGATPIVI